MKLSFLYSRLPAIILLICIVGISSCKKDNSPPPAPPVLDTLGTGWQIVTVPGNTGGFLDIFFVNNNVGWVAGQFLFKSLDGGVTWNKQTVLNDVAGFSNLFFVDELFGFAVRSDAMYRTKDGGASWKEIKITGLANHYDVQFLNHRLGYAVGPGGLFKSVDSGNTWAKVPSAFAADAALYFLDSLKAWVFNSNSKPGYTSNGGLDFAISNSFTGTSVYATQFIDPATGWAAGYNGAWRTADAGATWSPMVQGHTSDIHFFNKNDGFVCHRNEVFRTSNGGQTLTRVAKIGVTQGFIELHFTDPNHGWVASLDNYILRYAQ